MFLRFSLLEGLHPGRFQFIISNHAIYLMPCTAARGPGLRQDPCEDQLISKLWYFEGNSDEEHIW
jgi:hypothetical protein